MPNTHSTLTSLFEDIADSIRAKTGSSDTIIADEFPAAIAEIQSKPYTKLEYIESTGTQWINTGVTPTVDTGIYVEYSYVSAGSAAISGIFQNTRPRTDTLFISSNNGQTDTNLLLAQQGQTAVFDNSPLQINVRYSAKINYLNNNKLIANNEEVAITSDNGIYAYPIPLFARYNPNTNTLSISNARIYYAEITEGNSIIRQFIPARILNLIGLYDMVTGNFFLNSGTGEFFASAGVDT